MIAIKANKAYTVAEAEAKSWAARGYDVYGEEGLALHGAGRTVPVEALEEAEARIAELEAKLEGGSKEPTKAELAAKAAELGVEVPKSATKADIEALIAQAEAE